MAAVKRLAGKVALVTGGGTGIGEAICLKFAREGAKVVVCGFPGEPVEDVVSKIAQLGGNAIGLCTDISEEEGAREAVQATIEKFGKLSVLINAASRFEGENDTEKYSLEEFDLTLKHNVRATFLMTKHALPYLHKTQGNIISAGSDSGAMGKATHTTYGGTKGWVHAFMKGIALEQAPCGVRANCVSPGPIDIALAQNQIGTVDQGGEAANASEGSAKRRGTPEEVANVYAFLASDMASYVTGSIYFVEGGITIANGVPGEKAPVNLSEITADEPEYADEYEDEAERVAA